MINRIDSPCAIPRAACQAAREQDLEQSQRVIVPGRTIFFNEPLVLDNGDSGLTIESALGDAVCLFSGRKRRLANDESLVGLVSVDTKSHALIFVSRTPVLRFNIKPIDVGNFGP